MKNENDIKTILVVGLGMVSIAFIQKILELDDQHRYKITTCGEEKHLAYNRVALTEYFQHRSVEKLYLNEPEWYTSHPPERLQVHIGESITHINHASRTATTSSEGRGPIPYDICVLATGSSAVLPSYFLPSKLKSIKGIFVYRNIADLDSILAYLENHPTSKVVIAGGGLLGLEAAKALHDLKSVNEVTIVNRSGYPLSRQLDREGGEIVLKRIRGLGVNILIHTVIEGTITVTSSEGEEFLTGLRMKSSPGQNGSNSSAFDVDCELVIYAIGIKPRDELAKISGITCYPEPRGGIAVDDYLQTNVENIYALGECANWNGETYGLIGPGVEMADILSFNLTQLEVGIDDGSTATGFKRRKMNMPDLSTKLKLMGVDVASYGDFFAELRLAQSSHKSKSVWPITNGTAVESLVYRDPFACVYKKYIFSSDGKYLLGGMMVGETGDYVKMVALVKKKKKLDVSPSEIVLGQKRGNEEDMGEMEDDTTICGCHNVSKWKIVECINKAGNEKLLTIEDIKKKTKAGTGCGGCLPIVTNIFKTEMKKAGNKISNALCPHFTPHSRTDLFSIIKICKLKTFNEVMAQVGTDSSSVGCEICKPAIGSIMSSLWNEDVMKPVHHQNQDTNDRYLANIQRNGTFSVIPRVAAGEITPDKLIVLGQVAKKYNLYTKITGGQRVDLFGAKKADLPDIWEKLVSAGFESGHAYGKALRTVKSCVGTTWCRFGVGDSVGLAVQLEERYKGIRSPHKLKGGVSGCIRECAEAQSKDFGLIATDKGWNIFIAGNGGANPRHATLFASDVPPSKVVKILDRYLMYYIESADKLTRTARWVEQFEGGIEKLRRILIDDELGICSELERDMEALVGKFNCEWTEVVKNPERRKQFRQFVNTAERCDQIEEITERGQNRPANWPRTLPGGKLSVDSIPLPKSEWKWVSLAKVTDLMPTDNASTSCAVRYGDTHLSIFHVPGKGYFATQQMCPHKRAFVLDHGIIGDDKNGNIYVSCPLHKRNYSLTNGLCLNDDQYSIIPFEVRENPTTNGDIQVLLPPAELLDPVLGRNKWMIRQAMAEAYECSAATEIEIVGPDGQVSGEYDTENKAGCAGVTKLEW